MGVDDDNRLAVRVVDPSGAELLGMVHVELFRANQSSNNGPQQDGYCDSKGYYSFNGLRHGSYVVAVSAAGYPQQRYEVDLTHGDEQQLTVQLPRSPTAGAADSGSTVSVQQLGVPEKARRKFQKGYELYRHKDYKGAVKQLNEALEMDSGYVVAQNQLALSYWRLGKPDDARQWFETAIRTDPKFFLSYVNYAEMLSERKEYERAAALLKQASEAQPYQAEPYYLMGKIQLDSGNPERAEQALNQALKRDTSRIPEVHLLLANVYIRLQQLAKVPAQLQAYLAAAPHGIYARAAREDLDRLHEQELPQKK